MDLMGKPTREQIMCQNPFRKLISCIYIYIHKYSKRTIDNLRDEIQGLYHLFLFVSFLIAPEIPHAGDLDEFPAAYLRPAFVGAAP